MAAGDIAFYNKFKFAQIDGDANAALSGTPVTFGAGADTIKVAVMTASYVADTGDATTQEHWDDVSANQVATGTGYTGPITLASPTVTMTSGVVKFDANDVVIPQDASGFANGRYIVFYKVGGTDATSPLIAWGDLGATKSITGGSLTFQWNSNGIFTLT